MFGLNSKERNATKMVCYSELISSLTSAEIKPILILDVSGTFWKWKDLPKTQEGWLISLNS